MCEDTEDEPGKWVGLAGLEKGGSETTMEPITERLARFVRYRAIRTKQEHFYMHKRLLNNQYRFNLRLRYIYDEEEAIKI